MSPEILNPFDFYKCEISYEMVGTGYTLEYLKSVSVLGLTNSRFAQFEVDREGSFIDFEKEYAEMERRNLEEAIRRSANGQNVRRPRSLAAAL